jgi:hypothetical protein
MCSQDLSSFFYFQAFEKLLQAVLTGRATEISSNLAASAGDITVAVDGMAVQTRLKPESHVLVFDRLL